EAASSARWPALEAALVTACRAFSIACAPVLVLFSWRCSPEPCRLSPLPVFAMIHVSHAKNQAGPTPWRCPDRCGTSPGGWVLPGLVFERVILQQLCQAACLLMAGAVTVALSWPTRAALPQRSRLAQCSRAG